MTRRPRLSARPARFRPAAEALEPRATPALFANPSVITDPLNLGPNTTVAAVGRFNNDPFPDVVVSNYGSGSPNTVSLLFGQGDGSFNPIGRLTVDAGGPRRPEGVVAADLDGDGDSDIAVVLNDGNANNVLIFRSTGAFTLDYVNTQTLTAGTNATHITAADLDGDGDLDLAVSNFGGGVKVFRNTGGVFDGSAPLIPTGGTGCNQVVAADFDGDGDLDLAVANQDQGTIGLLRNDGAGGFTFDRTLNAGQLGTTFLAAADLNFDGRPDLVASNTFHVPTGTPGNTIAILTNAGGGAFDPVRTVTVGSTPTGVALRDFNGDGMTDIAVGVESTGQVLVLMNDGGPFRAPVPFAAAPGANGLTVGDFDGDGRPDLAVTQYVTGNGVAFLRNDLIGTTTTLAGPAASTPGQSVTFTATVTAPGDPVTTGFVSFFDGTTYLATIDVSNGTAAFTTSTLAAGPHAIRAVYSDLIDLNWFGSQSGYVNHVVSPPVSPPPPPPPGPPPPPPPPPPGGTVVQPLVVSGPANGSAVVLAPAGGRLGTTPAATLNPFGNVGAALRAATADVNGDGIADTILATGPGAPARLAIVSGRDNSTLLLPPIDPFGNDFFGGTFVAAGDFNGDGRAEVVVTPDEGGGPNVVIFSLDADGTIVPPLSFFALGNPAFRGGARVAVGDLNRDGVPDLAVGAGFLGGPNVEVYDGRALARGDSATLIGSGFFAFDGPDAVTLRNGVFLAVGDVNGDGFADLIAGGGPGGAPRVLVLSGQRLAAGDVAGAYANPLANFFVAGNEADRGGVRLAVKDVDADGRADVIAGSGAGSASRARVYLGRSFGSPGEPAASQDLDPFGQTLPGGVFVG